MNYFPNGVERIHTDGGGEYKFADDMKNIEHTWTTAKNRKIIPFTERTNRTVFDPQRTILEESGQTR